MDATAGGVAGIVGTAVVVVTVERRSPQACTTDADIDRRARVTVVAEGVVKAVYAAGGRIAGVIGAYVVVVAVEGRSSHTDAIAAGVSRGAGVTVVTGCGVQSVHAAGGWITGVIGTGVAIVTRSNVGGVHAAAEGVAGIVGAGIIVVTV
jgi:hypothetical protein